MHDFHQTLSKFQAWIGRRRFSAFTATRQRRLSTLVLTGIAVAIVACDRELPLGPNVQVPSRQVVGPTADQPFYFFQGQRVYLAIDPNHLLVTAPTTSTNSMRESDVQQAVASIGLPVSAVRGLNQARGHFLLDLPSGTTIGSVIAAYGRLKADPRFGFVSYAYQTLDQRATAILLDHVVVEFKSGVSRVQIDSLARALGLQLLREPRADSSHFSYWFRYPAGPAADALKIAATLDRHPLVKYADPDKIGNARPMGSATDPYYAQQFHLKNSVVLNGVTVDDNLEPAWNLTTGSHSTKVAVIDDGVDVSQQDMFGAFGGANGNDLFWPCGYADCVPGEGAVSPVHNDTHGTSVAGIIAADRNNTLGGAGIAPGITLEVVRIFRDDYPPYAPGNYAGDSKTADGIDWAWNTVHSDVISNSWGGGPSSNAIIAAVNRALSSGRGGKGTVVVFAAGNNANNDNGISGPLNWQAQIAGVIAVGAIDRNGVLADYSSSGPQLAIVALSGHNTNACYAGSLGGIVTTDRWGSAGCNDGPSGDINFTTTFSGTSAAAPQVSGVAALMLSRDPTLTAVEVKSRIQRSAVPWGPANLYGAGKLDAYGALIAAPTLFVQINGPSIVTTAGTYTWTASATGGTGSYSYNWEWSYDQSTYYPGGSNQTYSQQISSSDPIWLYLRVTVTSGSQVVTANLAVYNSTQCGILIC